MRNGLLHKVAEVRDKAPAARRAILDLVLEDPDRVLAESFELLARPALRRIHEVFGDEVVQHVEFIRVKGAVTCSGLPIVRWKGESRLREVMRILEEEGVYIADPHTWVVEDGGKKSINPRHVDLKIAMDPAGLLNPGKLRAWDEREKTQKKSVFWDS